MQVIEFTFVVHNCMNILILHSFCCISYIAMHIMVQSLPILHCHNVYFHKGDNYLDDKVQMQNAAENSIIHL